MPKLRLTALLLLVAVLIGSCCTLVYRMRRGDPGLKIGETAPKVEGDGWLNGEPPKPETLKGRVIVVYAWTSSGIRRGPCSAVAKRLSRVHDKYASRGVVFLGMTPQGDEELPRMKSFLGFYGVRWPNAYGAGKSIAAYKVTNQDLPGVWVIGRDGKVAWNQSLHDYMEVALEKSLGAPDPTACE